MTALSSAQSAVVGAPPQIPAGVAWPPITYEIHDLGDHPDYNFFRTPRQPDPDGPPPLAGYCAVVRSDGKWFAHREYHGGGHGSIGYATRAEAVADIESSVNQTAAFWMEKVGWKLAGDKYDARDARGRYTQQVIRCGGRHYTIGREPSDADYAANNRYGCFGFGGARLTWRLLATDELVGGRNCWTQGVVPAEFRELLPDNAERFYTEQEKAAAERTAAWVAEAEAKMRDRAEARATFSATGREHPLPDQVLMHVEDMDEDYDDTIGETRTATRDLDIANVAASNYLGYAGFDMGDDWHRPVLDLDMPAKLIPSSTPGHFHLFIDHPMKWETYEKLLEALAAAGVLEDGYVRASIARKHTAVRLPWIRKGTGGDLS